MIRTTLSRVANLVLGCALLAFAAPKTAPASGDVLIVADEMPQMELLVNILKTRANTHAELVKQPNMPASKKKAEATELAKFPEMPAEISGYRAVFVFIHHTLAEPVEKALIDYANSGGRLILLHHSISQGKGENKYWFPFLGMRLTPGDPEQGLYKWINPVTYTVVNLAPGNYITSHNVKYETKAEYKSSYLGTPERPYPAFTLKDSEVFINHVFTDDKKKTVLLGFKWQDPATGKVWMQDTAGWYKRAEKGWVIYLQPGHAVTDFETAAYPQIVLNALEAKNEGRRLTPPSAQSTQP